MTLDQTLSLLVLAGAIALFVWGRLRYDLVALLALLAGLAVGVVPADRAFTGFSDQVVIVVASALVVSRAIAQAGIVDRLLAPVAPALTTPTRQVAALAGVVTVLSAVMKNIGALALFLPVAMQLGRRFGTSPSLLLMPMAFGSLLGGLMTLIGTSPNIIVSRMREELTGRPFAMFDFLPVGAAVSAVGLVILTVCWRCLPERRPAGTGKPGDFTVQDYLTEVRLLPGSPLIGATVGDLERLSQGAATVAAVIRDAGTRYIAGEHWKLLASDIIVLEADPQDIAPLLAAARMEIAVAPTVEPWEEPATIEVVVTPDSPLVGTTAQRIKLRSRFGVNLLAVRRAGRDFVSRLRQMPLAVGDVVVLQGPRDALPPVLQGLGLLPLAYRDLALDKPRRRGLALPIVLAAMALVAAGAVPVAVGFFAAAVLVVVTGELSLRDAYEAIDWPILVMLGALIPVSDAVQATGASILIAQALAGLSAGLPPQAMVPLLLLAAMVVTPFLNNAATVLVMAPIAVGLGKALGLNADPLLMAVAVGAACDFLTPIGHQCNTLVMGPGGYRFGDYWRLGLPLSIAVLVVGSLAILAVWPVR